MQQAHAYSRQGRTPNVECSLEGEEELKLSDREQGGKSSAPVSMNDQTQRCRREDHRRCERSRYDLLRPVRLDMDGVPARCNLIAQRVEGLRETASSTRSDPMTRCTCT